MKILVGTASWTDKSLIDSGKFYPPEAKSPEARLRHYASLFPMVEVDSSYYAMPSASTAQLWAERTPADFGCNVKSFRLFTGHATQPKVLHSDIRTALPEALAGKKNLYYKDLPIPVLDELWRRFKQSLEPLAGAGKLAAVHFQFAPWVINNRDGQAHVRECVDRMGDHLLEVEFRNKTWFEGQHRSTTLEFEREMGVANVIVDSPTHTSNSVEPVWDVTSTRLAVLRLHGRNEETWNIKSEASSDRFNYDYSDDELRALVPQIHSIAEKVDVMHVVFNVNHEDQGQRNALTLMRLLSER